MIWFVFLFCLLFRWGILRGVLLVVGYCWALYSNGFLCVSSHCLIFLWYPRVLESVLFSGFPLQRLHAWSLVRNKDSTRGFSSVQFSWSVVSHCLWPHGLQHARIPCPSLTPEVYSKSCLLNQWCHLTISSSVIPFSSCLQSFPASGSFLMSQFFASGGQRIGVSALASILPMSFQDWFPLGWTDWLSLQSRRLSRIFSNTTVQKHQFFSTQLSL